MPDPMDLCRCEHTREAHRGGTGFCHAWRPSREMPCSCSSFVDRDLLHREWVASHPGEALSALVESGHLEPRHLMPIGPHIAQYQGERLLTPENAKAFAPELLTDCWVPGASTLPPLIGEKGADDGE